MAIQHRRGNYADFDPDRMVSGELAVVNQGDTSTLTGKSVRVRFEDGTVQTLVTEAELYAAIEDAINNLPVIRDFIHQEVAATLQEHPEWVTTVQDGSITTQKLASEAVTESELADGSVTTPKLADTAVTTPKLANASVTTEKINNNAITAGKLATGSISEDKILDSAITEGKIASDAVTNDKIADEAITEEKLADNSVIAGKVGYAAIGYRELQDPSVTTTKLYDGAVTEDKLNDKAVTTDKLALHAVTEDKLDIGAVTTSRLASQAVTFAKLSSTLIRNDLTATAEGQLLDARQGKALKDLHDTNASDISALNESFTWKTWQPHIYDFNTLLRSLSSIARYLAVGDLLIMYGNYDNPNLSGINTMLQIRNLPKHCRVLGGSMYIANLSGQGGAITNQIADDAIYFRPNITSSQLSNPEKPGMVCFFAVAQIL